MNHMHYMPGDLMLKYVDSRVEDMRRAAGESRLRHQVPYRQRWRKRRP